MKRLYLFFCLLFLATAGQAQDTMAYLLQDILPGEEGSRPTRFTATSELLYFRAETDTMGVEPFVTDGTPEGTRMLADLNTDSTFSAGNSNPDNFTEFNGSVYFTARAPETGSELYVTNGTTEGTMLLTDIQQGDGNGNPFDFVIFNDRLYFTANDGESSSELWSTDGTADGTMMVVDIRPGNLPGNPNFKTVFNDRLYFTANDGVNGNELWSTDGTPEGTMMVADINPGAGNSSPSRYFVVDSLLYFRANDGTTGTELYRTNGTTEGTFRVADIEAGEESSRPDNFFAIDGKLYFEASEGDNTAIYATTGDSVATATELFFAPNRSGDSNIDNIVEIEAGRRYFLTGFAVKDMSETNIYAIFLDGDTVRAEALDEVDPTLVLGNEPDDLIFARGSVFFTSETSETGRELVRLSLDADSATITRLPQLDPGARDAEIDDLTVFGPYLIFEAEVDSLGREPFALGLPRNPGRLQVIAAGDTLTSGTRFDFDNVGLSTDSTLRLVIMNTGEDSLVIDSLTLVDGSVFSIDTNSLTLMGGMSDTVTLTLMSDSLGTFQDTLIMFAAGDTNLINGQFRVPLMASVILISTRNPMESVRSVFPNPVTDRLTIELAAPLREATFQIVNNDGRTVRRGVWPAGLNRHRFFVGDLPTGVYHVLVVADDQRQRATFVKR